MENYLGKHISISGEKARYDSNVKKILADKTILAWILKFTAKEFMECSIAEILPCIEGEPEIGIVPVEPGRKKPEAITGNQTEDNVPNEGYITYDIRFYVVAPSKERIKLLINVEAQNVHNPGYNLVTRGIFYGARMISSQMDTEFTASNYDDIKKVYSIWVCTMPNQSVQDGIEHYHFEREALYGNTNPGARYDLISVIMIYMSGERETKNRLIRLLNVLLSGKLSISEKKSVLKEEFEIETSAKLEEELNSMCNLSDLIEAQGEARGEARGRAEGKMEKAIEIARNLLETNPKMEDAMISKVTGVALEDIQQLRQQI